MGNFGGMKRWVSLALALLLAAALTACGGKESSDDGASAKGADIYAENGYGEGRMGDVNHSVFMDFSVNDAYTTADYNGCAASEGRQLLVVEMTIKNVDRRTLSMWDDDFQAQWTASEETDEFAWPITEGEDGDLDTVAEEQLPAEYELSVNESRTGTLVFDVPAGERDFSISHQELFDDGSVGDTFFVFFTAREA